MTFRAPRPALAGKTVVDATNYYPARDGDLPELNNGNTTSSELLAAYLPEAHVIKAFNTMYYETLATGGQVNAPHEQRLALFIAGDDDQAKRTVAALIRGCRHRFARSRRRAPATWKRYLQPATQRS